MHFYNCKCKSKCEKMVIARKYVVKKYFLGMPKPDDFDIVEYKLPPLKEKEVLVKAEWISVDPYMRAYNTRYTLPYDQFGYQVGVVQESRNPKYPIGSRVVSHIGWADYAILDEGVRLLHMYKLPDLKGLPTEIGLGAAGAPGATAYFGFLDICKPKSGETVVVTGAAGAVGSMVGQIAKIKGCRVIGFAGSDEKVAWLEKELGFDKGINYKTADIDSALRQAAPKGIDCFFDNVGGEIATTIISQMNMYGRVSISGCICVYNNLPTEIPRSTSLQFYIMLKQLKMVGFEVMEWFEPEERLMEVFNTIIDWIKSGKIKYGGHVTKGFDNMLNSFVGMLSGENFGKAVVKV